jgi:hypothetical protein
MRHSFGQRCCFAMLLGSACTAPPEPDSMILESEPPAIEFAAVPPPLASAEPDAPPGYVGPNPGCPSLQVFTDAKDLCARGIMPTHPFGRCRRLPTTNDGARLRADVVQIAAMGGSVELFVKHYIGSGDSSNETVYLALRGENGYVLLNRVVDYSSQGNDEPQFERFVGDATSVEVHTLQTWFSYDYENGKFREESRRRVVRCTLAADGSIRCNDECPDLAIAKPLPPLDCAALASVDWAELPRGVNVDTEEDWGRGGQFDQDQICIARAWLGLDDGKCWEAPHRVRRVDLEPERTELTILEPKPGRWLLLHQQVPLAASRREIRVGRAPGGLFVSSWTEDGRRIQRLNLATHELEPVLPGPCGSGAPL